MICFRQLVLFFCYLIILLNIIDQYESIAISLISKYNGQLLIRSRPTHGTIIAQHIEIPYEIHLVSFNTETDFENFMKGDERKKLLDSCRKLLTLN
jgi:hypothetical protein